MVAASTAETAAPHSGKTAARSQDSSVRHSHRVHHPSLMLYVRASLCAGTLMLAAILVIIPARKSDTM
jgi:hypothetical protein